MNPCGCTQISNFVTLQGGIMELNYGPQCQIKDLNTKLWALKRNCGHQNKMLGLNTKLWTSNPNCGHQNQILDLNTVCGKITVQ
jgi:hypothetical protein